MPRPPVFNIDLAMFHRDPYPILKRLRETAPVATVPQLNGIVVSKRQDIVTCEKNTKVFSSHQPDGLMNKLMGHNMMRKDGAEHTHERKMLLPTYSVKTIEDYWRKQFHQDVDARLDQLTYNITNSNKADLFSEFAMPVSADALKTLTGLTDCSAKDLDKWSQAMIDGVSNYVGNSEIEACCREATNAIDIAINLRIKQLREAPDNSMLGAMLKNSLPEESIRANIKLAISGGQNEPRDAIAGTIWALLTHPEQLEMIFKGHATWHQAFEEYLRWMSPIGMSPRRIAEPYQIQGFDLEPEDKVFFLFNSANRDEEWFDNPDDFNLSRDNKRHIGFGAGPHFCIAAAASRTLACDVALPALFARFENLQLDTSKNVQVAGWAFRGILNLPVSLE